MIVKVRCVSCGKEVTVRTKDVGDLVKLKCKNCKGKTK